jgi:hypothetical protein
MSYSYFRVTFSTASRVLVTFVWAAYNIDQVTRMAEEFKREHDCRGYYIR